MDWVAIAELVRPRGTRGELVGEPLSDHPERFSALRRVFLNAAGARREVAVLETWWHDRRLVFRFDGIDSIAEAEKWRGALVEVPAGERWPLPAGRYYHSDLIGCRVERAGVAIGVVTDVEEPGAQSLLSVRLADGRQASVPLVPAVCPEVDIAGRRIVIDPPEGLLDLDSPEVE
ncbi:MAG: ribosome maturation factor RimM [Bryobacteraceae bacterium]|nr:ribosome maturation factor RimM [Bryobacteraceae bacterium]